MPSMHTIAAMLKEPLLPSPLKLPPPMASVPPLIINHCPTAKRIMLDSDTTSEHPSNFDMEFNAVPQQGFQAMMDAKQIALNSINDSLNSLLKDVTQSEEPELMVMPKMIDPQGQAVWDYGAPRVPISTQCFDETHGLLYEPERWALGDKSEAAHKKYNFQGTYSLQQLENYIKTIKEQEKTTEGAERSRLPNGQFVSRKRARLIEPSNV